MLAMVVNDDAYFLKVRGVLETIASVLAPTGGPLLFLQLQVPAIGNGRCTCIKSGISRHLIHACCW